MSSLTSSHGHPVIRKTATESLIQSHATALVGAVQGTYVVFMAKVHSLESLPGYALD